MQATTAAPATSSSLALLHYTSSSTMNQIPDATLLIQDLLSPPSTLLPSTTPTLITYHLTTLPLTTTSSLSLISLILQYLSTSPSLWQGTATYSPTNTPHWSTLSFTRAKEIHQALLNGVLYRAGELSREHGTGWTSRRKLTTFLEAYFDGCVKRLEEGNVHPVVRLLTACAALEGLQTIKARKEKLYVGGSALMGRAEKEVMKAWEEYFRQVGMDGEGGSAARSGGGEWTANGEDISRELLPSWLAAQTLPTFPVARLAEGPVSPLLRLLTHSFSATFASGHLFSTLPSALISTPDGLTWTIPSSSHTLLTSLIQSPLFVNLGRLSRAIGRLIEASASLPTASNPLALVQVQQTSTTLERLTTRVQSDWSATTWSDIPSDLSLSPATRAQTEPWTLLRSLLFSITLIHSSLLIIVSPSPGRIPTRLQLELAKQAVRVLKRSYFVAIKFGPEGFSAWRGVWVGLLEVAGQDTKEGVEEFMRELEPSRMGELHSREVERSETTFYLNAAEHLMKVLGDKYVELSVLRCCHPYLEDATYRDTFESAHSVLLAVFATNKKCAKDLAPWYSQMLLKAYPTLMTATQLRLAYTTIVRCVSTSDDALAWYCIVQLIHAIRAIPISTSPTSPSVAVPPLAALCPVQTSPTPTPQSPREFDDEATQTRLDEVSSLSPLEARALSLQRGHLLLTLIDQTTSVNLILLRKLLNEIWSLIQEEDVGENEGAGEEGENGRQALVKVVFNTLGEGLDATKREEGVRYWLERGEELAFGTVL